MSGNSSSDVSAESESMLITVGPVFCDSGRVFFRSGARGVSSGAELEMGSQCLRLREWSATPTELALRGVGALVGWCKLAFWELTKGSENSSTSIIVCKVVGGSREGGGRSGSGELAKASANSSGTVVHSSGFSGLCFAFLTGAKDGELAKGSELRENCRGA